MTAAEFIRAAVREKLERGRGGEEERER